MTNIEVQQQLEKMVRSIVESFHPEKIILFGSHARNAGTPESDVDLLIVMPFHGSRRKVAIAIDVKLGERSLPLDVLVVTPEEMERERGRVGTILPRALKEGRVLYDRAA